MNPDLAFLHSYPFEKLAALKQDVAAPEDLPAILLSIGEPQHPAPDLVVAALAEHMQKIAKYPTTRGTIELRQAISDWLQKRFQLPASLLDPETRILPVCGTREALFAFAQASLDRSQQALVLMPNPFYQIYEGAALLGGGQPYFLDCTAQQNFLPEFDSVSAAVWQRCQLLYLCSPGNPTGAVVDLDSLKRLIELAQQHDFIIASDECYSEIYRDERRPPPGLLQAAAELGLDDFKRCVVFHSLSKRSNLAGLRSGFVAGDPDLIQQFFSYRTYHGCAMPVQVQMASIAAWRDEAHVVANRAAYREKFDAVADILAPAMNFAMPDAGFYLWAQTPDSDTDFCRELHRQQNVTLLPGSFLGRDNAGVNPGSGYVRIALVPPLEQCCEAASRIASFVNDN
jgi:N-succinyldiaminopimelate aminotransferase